LPEEMFFSLKKFIEISGHSFLNALKMSKNQINELIFIF